MKYAAFSLTLRRSASFSFARRGRAGRTWGTRLLSAVMRASFGLLALPSPGPASRARRFAPARWLIKLGVTVACYARSGPLCANVWRSGRGFEPRRSSNGGVLAACSSRSVFGDLRRSARPAGRLWRATGVARGASSIARRAATCEFAGNRICQANKPWKARRGVFALWRGGG